MAGSSGRRRYSEQFDIIATPLPSSETAATLAPGPRAGKGALARGRCDACPGSGPCDTLRPARGERAGRRTGAPCRQLPRGARPSGCGPRPVEAGPGDARSRGGDGSPRGRPARGPRSLPRGQVACPGGRPAGGERSRCLRLHHRADTALPALGGAVRGAGRLLRRPRRARPPARALSPARAHRRRRPRLCPHARDDRGGLHDALLHPPLLRRRSGRARLRGSAHRRRGRGCRGRAAPGGGAPPPGRAHASRAGPLPRGSPQRAPRRRDAGARHEPMARRLIARDIVADGIRIHVGEAGEGPALMLLHGLTATHFTWEHTIPAFADRWRVIAPDLPGHGRSEKPDAPYTIDFYAGVIRSLARALDVDEALVVGNSLGGQIAVELGLAYPRFTRALALAAPAGGSATGMRP